jgi:hypothetical protein
VPRRLFKQRNTEMKRTDPNFMVRSAPLPTNEASRLDPGSELEAWRRKMANTRRKNLEEGIASLWMRHDGAVKRKVDTQRRKQTYNKRAMEAPQREDERLTEATIPAHVYQMSVAQDPDRFETALASQARTAGITAKKSQDRQELLQELYMKARSFIVDEAVLEQRVNALFKEDTFTAHRDATGFRADNIWDLQDKPLSLRELTTESTGLSGRFMDLKRSDETKTHLRQKRVAEELTGGPMD